MSNVNNVKSKTTPITLSDGVKRELKFTLNALAEMEDKYGSVEEAFKALEKNSIKAIRFVLWAGLLHTDENLTEQQVGNLIDVQCMEEIMSQVSTALNNDMPAPGDDLPNAVTPA
jgi:hypothetical protein